MNKDTLPPHATSGIPEYNNDLPSIQQFPYEKAGTLAKACRVLSGAALVGMGAALYYHQGETALLSGGVAFMSILAGAVSSDLADRNSRESYTEML